MIEWDGVNRCHHPYYEAWRGMVRRCRDPKYNGYPTYGAVGIKVCDEWLDLLVFARDMGEKPTKSHSIDRIDSRGNYEPSNCRWATVQEQVDNRRVKTECFKGHPWTKENTIFTHNGTGMTRRCKICRDNKRSALKERIRELEKVVDEIQLVRSLK